ncbi:GSCOCG00008720001-RA-CDS [Cotesia congregata]|uniref:Protein O-mannosyltransferase 1 n=1 Tax=Cotesia congregata TaxID=51543 RepID=A0A8J2HID7_COTCN|nr:GSCOCG00008720001-RA-CDS [Cotesia congregata]CAG5096457.1 Similar to rt: Protein O-mannosyltransferase 1 (Drosophila melanogaster) [Cotesia congregata]
MEVRNRKSKSNGKILRETTNFDDQESKIESCSGKNQTNENDKETLLFKQISENFKIDERMLHEISNPSKRMFISLEFDVIAVFLFVAGILTRLYKLEEPKSIVFDELHFGKYVGLYMKRIFFFDSHPPLGKQLISAAAYLSGFDGEFKFDRIGSPYPENVPLFALRVVPALFGSLILPTAYHLAIELGLKPWSALIAGIMFLLDNAFLTQSRFILMESILVQFSLFGLFCIMKFHKVMDKPQILAWWVWLTLGIVSLTCAICVKYVGFYSLMLGIFIITRDYWKLLSKKTLSNSVLWGHFIARVLVIILSFSSVYLGVFYIHLSVLTKAGPHDAVMTSAFQASLEGGLASITKGQPTEVTHGSQITLRHTFGRACWLHSHNHLYPLRYPDGRGSSHQQQVTCYSFKDVNNWWIVKRPELNDLVVTRPIVPLKHGEVVQLVHGITSRALNSHDVAAAMTPQSQEVSCYIDYNVSMPAQNLWRIEIINREQTNDIWYAIQSQVRLIHVGTEYALKFSGRQLADWGFNQHEVVADKIIEQEDAVWNVEEHRYTKSEDQKQRERELINAEMIPLKATRLSFWQKFIELQIKMLFHGQESQTSHMYSSGPLEWPLLTRGIAYWVASDSNAQVHLLGNIAVWYSGTIGVVIYSILLIIYLTRRKRCYYDIPDTEWDRVILIGQVLFAGYILHFIPFFFVERTLFLHNYLPALAFKILLTAAVIDHLYYLISWYYQSNTLVLCIRLIIIILWLALIIFVFQKFAILSYGMTPLTAKDLMKLRWSETWDFIVHKL